MVTPFEFRPFPIELQLCQRYFSKSYSYNIVPGVAQSLTDTFCGVANTNGNVFITIIYPIEMRNIPQFILYNPYTGATGTVSSLEVSSATGSIDSNTRYGSKTTVLYVSGLSSQSFYIAHYSGNAEL